MTCLCFVRRVVFSRASWLALGLAASVTLAWFFWLQQVKVKLYRDEVVALKKGSIRSSAANSCAKLLWIHVPKTSSTFCMSIQHACCQSEFEHVANKALAEVQRGPTKRLRDSKLVSTGWGCTRLLINASSCRLPTGRGHRPLLPNEDAAAVVMLLREPRSRILSAYLDGRHSEGLAKEEFRNAVWRNTSLRTDVRMQAYASHPSMKGCQTKLLLGQECCSSMNVTNAMQYAAEEILTRALFVGIFERYAESISLFHSTMQRDTTPHPLELTLGRSGTWHAFPSNVSSWTEDNIVQWQEREEAKRALGDYQDPVDEALYSAAVRLFNERVASGRTTPPPSM